VAVPEPFVVAFVLGVTPGKWARIWEERMPRHPLELRQLSPDAAVAALRDGTAHVALVRTPVDDGSLSAIPLYAERAVVVVPKDHAIEALDEVATADLVGETILDGEWAAAVELVAAGVGVAVMPQSVARALSRRDVVARTVTDATETRIALVWPTESTAPEVEEFIGIVRGRTANSSRGEPTAPQPKPTRTKRPDLRSSGPSKKGQRPRRKGY
jgi:DNA-binding transcriptional LysR family regulator